MEKTNTADRGENFKWNNLFFSGGENSPGKQCFSFSPNPQGNSLCHGVKDGNMRNHFSFRYSETEVCLSSLAVVGRNTTALACQSTLKADGGSIFHCQLLLLSCNAHSPALSISMSLNWCASQSAPLNPKAVPGQPFCLHYLFPSATLNSSSHNIHSS